MRIVAQSRKMLVIGCVVAFALASPAFAAPNEQETDAAIRALPWQAGPATAAIADKSTIAIPKDGAFLNSKVGTRFLELNGNLPSPGISVLTTPSWWAVFDFDAMGYVKDGEKIDADALLKTIQESDEPANEERRKQGLAELHTEGWSVPPHYDSDTKHLEWGLRLRSSSSPPPVVNYTVRLLGRTGVQSAVLVTNAETLNSDVQSFKALLKTFEFNRGERYAEFRPGDHVAEIGLGALVAGGTAAVVVKSGLWKVILAFLAASWKVIAVGVVAVGASVGRLVKRKPS